MVLAEMIADDQRRRHVDEAGADAVHETVRQKQPLGLLDEGRAETAGGKDGGAEQAGRTVAVGAGDGADKADGQRGTRQRHAERQRPDPVCIRYDTIRYDTRCYFNVQSKADMSQLNLPHGTNN